MGEMIERGVWITIRLIACVVVPATLLPAKLPVKAPGETARAAAVAVRARTAPYQRVAAAPTAPAAPAAPIPGTTPPPGAVLAGIDIVRELDIPNWLRPGEYVWDDDGVPAGPLVIVVNIRGRVLSAFRGGIEIGRSSLIYGADEKPTPHGSFPILEKDADHHSSLYDAPMPYMLRLTWDGVAIHGSPELADDLATHGCVGLPDAFAAKLFAAAKVGDQVVVWNGERPA